MHEGRVDEACSLYEEVRRLVPGHRFAEMAADRLGDLDGLRSRPPAGAEPQESPPDLSELFQGARRLFVAFVDGAIEPFIYTKKPTKKIEMLVNSSEILGPIGWNPPLTYRTEPTLDRIDGGISAGPSSSSGTIRSPTL
jgi:hypothetical protein